MMLTRPTARFIDHPAKLLPYKELEPFFYHVMDLPGGIRTKGCWDLRGQEDTYLGFVDLDGMDVLEIGPASGFLTAAMERRGASVTAVEIPEGVEWDFVPYASHVLDDWRSMQLRHLPFLRQTFWYTHAALNLRARMVHAHAADLPDDIGSFDIALLASVLLHTKSPHDVIRSVARLTDRIIIVEPLYPDLEGLGPLIRLHPNTEKCIDACTWWHFSTSFLSDYLQILGFRHQRIVRHRQYDAQAGRASTMFTLVAGRNSAWR